MKNNVIFVLISYFFTISFASANDHKEMYRKVFEEQSQMIKGEKPIDFKRAVFITENAFHKNTLSYFNFCNRITNQGNQLKQFIKAKNLSNYKTGGNYAVFNYMMQPSSLNDNRVCSYDFDDFMGRKDWTKMFVTKLMDTKGGNCHSLPYYYKILCEEIGAKASLALAPNHIYIKHIDEEAKWTNIELTNGGFPRDQWMIQQMAISVEAIKNNVYMKPLTQKESIAMTMFDLACGYDFQFGEDEFYFEIVETALSYFPTCIPLLMCKSNYYGGLGMKEQKKTSPDPKKLKYYYDLQTAMLEKINALGHKEMPPELYRKWVESVEKEKQSQKN